MEGQWTCHEDAHYYSEVIRRLTVWHVPSRHPRRDVGGVYDQTRGLSLLEAKPRKDGSPPII